MKFNLKNMSKLGQQFERQGDKKNSEFFEENIEKIYSQKEKTGLQEMIEKIAAVMVQVETGDLLNFLAELYVMTPYRFHKGFITKHHKIAILRNIENTPDYIILEPLNESYSDKFTSLNLLYPRAAEKPNARYLGEIFKVQDLKNVVKILDSEEIRIQSPSDIKNEFLNNENFRVSDISYFTNNVIAYTEKDTTNWDEFNIGESFQLSNDEKSLLETVDETYHNLEFNECVLGLDHLATRILCNDREYALLEFLSMTNYYLWGAYNIEDMNSSTNVSRNPSVESELTSPAKVFTSNNTPYLTKRFDQLPSPTEDFVRNFGKRMHHLAIAVRDGERSNGLKNIDYVVGKLNDEGIPFLAQIIGECTDFPDLKQIFSKSSNYSILITEYVQRCHNFQGFFTKENVASLTQAAGEDEALKKAAVSD